MVNIVCTDEDGNVCTAEMEVTALVEDLQAIIEVELGTPITEQQLIAANGMILCSNETLEAQGIINDTRVTVCRVGVTQTTTTTTEQKQQNSGFQNSGIPLDRASALIEQLFQTGSTQRQPQQQQNSPLPVINEEDPEIQRKLYEAIQQRNLQENIENAFEFTPEVFTQVTMLFVNCEINKVKVKAFVDSGAQVSVMNARTAEKCGLMRLLDTRMAGVVRGVGEQRSLGRIHMALVNLGGLHIPISICVLENQQIDFILGLDQMKRHRMIIDLHDNCLRVEDTKIPFLPESELPAFGNPLINQEEINKNASDEERKKSKKETVIPETSPASGDNAANNSSSVTGGVYSETVVESLVSLTGIPRERAIALLEAAGWNPDVAMSLLLDE